MAIQKLPEEVRSAVRSGIAISSTAQCVTELVMNSLDAGASSVTIHLDIPHFKIEVDDNGSGITLEDLHYVGIRYHTSKCRDMQDLQNNLKYNGYRGEALASLSESCGFLVIVTRSKNGESEKTYLKAFTRGKAHKPIETPSTGKGHGTTVTVQDFMCNAPVRQKRIIPNVDIEEIRIQVEGIALSHPHVSFTLIDDSEKTVVRRIPSTSSSLETFTQLYGLEISKNLQPIGPLTSGKLSISGCLSTSSYHNKRLQFIFVNGRLVKGTKIHKLINMIMRKSDVLRGNGPWQELPMPERMRDFLWVSPLKKKDRYCVFMVHISCPISEYDITLDPRKTLIEFCDWDTLFECMENVVKSFLKEHNLACIATDPEITNSQSSSDSPLSVINEMEQLEKEDALGQRLSQFRCPIEANGANEKPATSGKRIINMATAIHSIPAKRNISNAWVSTVKKCQNLNEKETKETVGDGIASDIASNEDRCTNDKHHDNKLGEVSSIDKVELIKFPLLPEDSGTSSCSSNNLKDSYHQYNSRLSIQDSGIGPLGRFRQMYQKNLITSLQTPEDIQKISVDEPPPIIRRAAPLEHRVKGLAKSRKFTDASTNTEETVFNKSKGMDACKRGTFLLKDFEFDRKVLKNPGKDIYFSQDKRLLDTKICLRNVSRHNDLLSKATQTDSNFGVDKEGMHEEKSKGLVKGYSKPNLKMLNVRRRQFQETSEFNNRIKVFKYDDMNRDSGNEMEAGTKISTGDSQCDYHQHGNNDLMAKCSTVLDYLPHEQTGGANEHSHQRERTFAELSSHIRSTNKPNLAKLKLRKKFAEETENFKSVTEISERHDLPEQTLSSERSHNDSQLSINNLFECLSIPKTINEYKKQNNDINFVTSDDFIYSLKLGKESKENTSTTLLNSKQREDDIAFSVPSSCVPDSFHNSVDDDNDKLEDMPILEPFFHSEVRRVSGPDHVSDSPPSLMDDECYLHHPDREQILKSVVSSKELCNPIFKEMAITSCEKEERLAECESSNEKINNFQCETSKHHESPNINELKPEEFLDHLPKLGAKNDCFEKKLGKIRSLVPMYSSDSEDSTVDEIDDTEILPQTSHMAHVGHLEGSVIQNNAASSIKKSSCFPVNVCHKVNDITNDTIDSASKVFSSQNSPDLFNDIELGKEAFSEVDNYSDLGGEGICLKNILRSKEIAQLTVSHGEQFKCSSLKKYEITTGDNSSTLTPDISVAAVGGEIKSPFFAESSEWDKVLSEACCRIENTENVKILPLQSDSAAYSNCKKIFPKDLSYQQNKFEMLARPPFFPKGLSPVMPGDSPQIVKDSNALDHVLSSQEENSLHSALKQSSMLSDELSWIKWSSSSLNIPHKEIFCGTTALPENHHIPMIASLLTEAQDKKLISEADILTARVENQSKSFIKVFRLLHPCTFSKEVLSNFKMIGKMDRKFIVAKVNLENEKCSSAIVLFDQHAVHERIRLERLTQEYQIRRIVASDNDKVHIWYKSAPVVPAFELTLDISEARLLDSFHEHFQRLGLGYELLFGDEKGSGNAIIKVTEVPACLISKDPKESGPLGLKEQVHALIREQVDHLLVTRGVGVFSPSILRDAINMKACRGAVKFGDSLSDKECRWLLRKLSSCDTPFQCAHGRPSMYPIVELKQLNRFYCKNDESCKPRLWRLKQMMDAVAQQKKVKTIV